MSPTKSDELLKLGKVYSVLFLLVLILFSCNQPNDSEKMNKATLKAIEAKGYVAPAESLKPPQTVLLSTMPKPLTIEIPTKAGGSYIKIINNQETKIDLLPPVTKPAGVFYFMQSYTSADGLALDTIYCSIIDKTGNLWFGSNGGGVSKYDGKSFITYSTADGLSNGAVLSILEDKEGNLWFGTNGGGVSKYDGKSFTTYTTEDGLADNYIKSILEDKRGNLWFGTGGGISKYDGKSFSIFTTAKGLANNHILSILEDKTGNLWFGTDGGGVSKYDGKSFATYTMGEGLANNVVLSILEDKKGNLWFGTDGGGVSKYDGKSFTTYTTKQGLVGNSIWSILEDKKGNLWFGTDRGASEYNGQSFTNYTTAQGLVNNTVRSILEDKTGNLWFGTFGGGVSEYAGKSFTNYTTAQGLAYYIVRSIFEDKIGNLWFSTNGGGVSKYDGKSFTTYTTEQGLADNFIRGSLEDKMGNLWFGTFGGGASKYDGKSFTTYTTLQGLANNFIRYILEDKTGNLWFGTDGGVSKYDGKSFTNYTTEQGLAENHIWSIHEDKIGNLWFGTWGGGVSRYDGKSFTNYTTAQGLAKNFVFCILEDKTGNLLFGTEGGGVSRYDGESFITYSTEQGLPDNSVYQAIITKEQNIALGTNHGIAVLTGYTPLLSPYANASGGKRKNEGQVTIPAQNHLKNEALKSYKPVFEIYNSQKGYPIKDANGGQNSMFLDSKGIMWIGTGSDKTGLVRLDFAALNKNNNPPDVFIQSVKIDDENISWYDLINKKSDTQISKTKNEGTTTPPNLIEEVITFGKPLSDSAREAMRSKFGDIKFDNITKFYYVPENLELPHDHNNITFEFAAIEPSLPQNVLYQYKLEGYDKKWSPPSNKTSATFGNMFEGTYPFKVKAQSPYGIWSEPITYTFRVLPPWYRTWWAYLLYAISSITSLYLIFQWRTATLRHRQKQLEQTVMERTAEVVEEKERSDELLLNILPAEVAKELKARGSTKAKTFDDVSVMFTDFKSFTSITEHLTAEELVAEIDYCFKGFDTITNKYNIEKIKTIGDSYMAAGGLPVPNKTHAKDVVHAALEIVKFMEEHNQKRKNEGKDVFEIRIGIHTGPVIAGVVGIKKFTYDIWGDTVNIASRMESSGEPGKVNISGSTYELVKNDFTCDYRGKVQAKGKGQVDMYFVS